MASLTRQRKSHVFRVTGLSRDMPDEDLHISLQNALHDNFTDKERSQIKTEITIVPSCYDQDAERVALVQFRGGVPQFLSELTLNPLRDWQVETDDGDISIDCHFFGFTQLYSPDSKEPVVADIIAIAGLDGHAYGSWQGRGNLGRMWLRDFLSKDLPRCRTMIYGYNSKLSSHGVDTILDYGRELMEEIKKVRNTKELQRRPLFFIAHSFGGIILAHCLVRAIQTMDEDHPAITSLHRATYSMIFFGIPHKGLVVEDIQQMLAGDGNHPREKLLQQISSKSDLLVHQLADFKNLIRDRKVVSFYEMEQTRRLVFDTDSQRWKRTGDFITTVDADSALLQLPDHVEDKVPLHSDHSMMVKFDTRNAAGYRTVLDKLRQFAKDAPAVVAGRFTQARHRPQPCSTVPFKKDPMFVGREDVISAIKEKHGTIGQCHERVALVGLAGIGKTQAAIEYSHRVRESTRGTWVFWIHASNTARLEQSYQDIAAVAEIAGRDDPKANIFHLVYQWLCDECNGRWLMVLDNADDDQIFFRSDDADGRASLVALVLSRQGKYDEAEAMHRRALEAREKVLGREHPNTLISVDNLGGVFSSQGKYDEAEAMHRRALEGYEKVLGRKHPNTLISVDNLGLVLSRQGKYDEAEAMHRRDLEGSEKVLGREHPHTLTSVNNLGLVLSRQGKYDEAEAMHGRALEAREKVLGREHPNTLISVDNLGGVFSRQGKYDEAEAMHRRALEAREKMLGREHPDTLASVNNLRLVLSSQGKYDEAEAMHRRALEGYE